MKELRSDLYVSYMFVLNPDGKVIYQGAIDSNPEAAGATNYVKAALEESMAGKPFNPARTRPMAR